MENSILKGSVALENSFATARNKLHNIASGRAESGDIVQTIIIIAMFVIICVTVGFILMNSINGQAEKVGDCITNIQSGNCTDYNKK